MANCITLHFRQQQYQLKWNIGFFLLCVSLFSLFCTLGTWQIHRYHYKKALVLSYEHRQASASRPFLTVLKDSDRLQFQKVSLQGQYVNELTMILQNQFYKNQPGFEVITPLRIPGQSKLLLVNRGWVKDSNEAHLYVKNNEETVTGYLKLLNEYHFILGKNILSQKTKPIMMQKIDVDELNQLMHQSFYPFILRLDPNAAHGFVRDWIISTSPPERHMAYAIQWFAMALTVIIGYVCFCYVGKSADEKIK